MLRRLPHDGQLSQSLGIRRGLPQAEAVPQQRIEGQLHHVAAGVAMRQQGSLPGGLGVSGKDVACLPRYLRELPANLLGHLRVVKPLDFLRGGDAEAGGALQADAHDGFQLRAGLRKQRRGMHRIAKRRGLAVYPGGEHADQQGRHPETEPLARCVHLDPSSRVPRVAHRIDAIPTRRAGLKQKRSARKRPDCQEGPESREGIVNKLDPRYSDCKNSIRSARSRGVRASPPSFSAE